MPLVDKLLSATIKYLQRKQKSLRRSAKGRKAGHRKKKAKKGRPKFRQGSGRKPKKAKVVGKILSKHPPKKHRPPLLEKKPKVKPLPEKALGVVTHYFSRIEVVVVELTKAGLKVGDTIRIKGKTTDFAQKVKSLQIESVDVSSAKKGALVGLKVVRAAKEGDKVFLVGQN